MVSVHVTLRKVEDPEAVTAVGVESVLPGHLRDGGAVPASGDRWAGKRSPDGLHHLDGRGPPEPEDPSESFPYAGRRRPGTVGGQVRWMGWLGGFRERRHGLGNGRSIGDPTSSLMDWAWDTDVPSQAFGERPHLQPAPTAESSV